MYCGRTHDEAHRVAGGPVIRYLDFFGSIDARSPHRSKAYEHHQGGTQGMFDGITSRMLDEQKLLLMSDPAGLVERIDWARDYYGLDYLLLEVGQGGLPHEQVTESLTRFAEEVMPVFAAGSGPGDAVRDAR